jgi:hypothetical protein
MHWLEGDSWSGNKGVIYLHKVYRRIHRGEGLHAPEKWFLYIYIKFIVEYSGKRASCPGNRGVICLYKVYYRINW